MGALTSMAAIALGAVDLLQRQSLARAEQERLAVQQRASRETVESRIEQLRADQAEADRERREALLRSMAAARARLGASGGGTASGSGAALLRGLAAEAAREGAVEADRVNRRVGDLTRALGRERALNLLERSEAETRARLGLIRDSVRLGNRFRG